MMGIYLGDHLLSGGADNPDGYFEDARIVRVQQKVLQRLDRQWTGPKGFYPLSVDCWTRIEVGECADELANIIRNLSVCADGAIAGFKDPRTARLLPLWNAVFKRLDTNPRFILVIRNPCEVIESLARRNALRTAQSELLWLQCNVSALMNTIGRSLLVVDYNQWFVDCDRQYGRLAKFLGLDAVDEVRSQIANIVDPQKHHCQKSATVLHFEETERMYAALGLMAGDLRSARPEAEEIARTILAKEKQIVNLVCRDL
jgi:hypothetical protein